MASFDSASFSTSAFSEDAFDFGDTPDSAQVFGGHFVDERVYKKYHEKLKKLAKAYEDHDNRQYIKNIVDTAEISDDLPVPTPEISQARAALEKGNIPQIDFEMFAQDINRLILYLENAINQKIREVEQEDEMVLLLLL